MNRSSAIRGHGGASSRQRAPLARMLLVLLSFLAVAAHDVRAQEPAAGSSAPEVERLREAIEESRRRVGAHEREERDLLTRLDDIDRSLEALRQAVRAAEREAKSAEQALAEVDVRLVEVRRRLASTRRAMARRAVALYKAGEVGPVRLVFASSSVQALLSKVWTLGKLLEYDAAMIARFTQEHVSLQQVEDEAARSLRRRDEARLTLAARSREFEADKRVKREILTHVRGDRSAERALLIELERAARALEETLASLGAGQSTAATLDGAGFERRRGRLAAPVPGRIAQAFGRVIDEEYQTETFRKGVEFGARGGESVRAVARGQVRFAGWFRGYGKIVIVDHGDGYFTVSGHLAEVFVEPGDLLDEGDTLGTVGDTGSLSGPSLYFELRAGGSPLDPADWLGKS